MASTRIRSTARLSAADQSRGLVLTVIPSAVLDSLGSLDGCGQGEPPYMAAAPFIQKPIPPARREPVLGRTVSARFIIYRYRPVGAGGRPVAASMLPTMSDQRAVFDPRAVIDG